MTEETNTKAKYGPRKDVDWEAIKRHWCANKMTDTELSRQYGVSRAAISKKAGREGWTRDLSEKVEAATQDRIRRDIAGVAEKVAQPVTRYQKVADQAVVDAYAEVASAVDSQQRADVRRALDVQRAMLIELETLSKPELMPFLEAMAEALDESGPTAQGGWKSDKINELYRYIISLGGRIKMAKELGAAHGVYLPLQRKMFKLDEGKSAAPFEELLTRLGSAQQESP